MAKIPVYVEPDREIHPEEKGFSAFETAGRRVGPAYNEAASLVRDQGRLTATIYKERMWPFDILDLYQQQAKDNPQPTGGINVRSGGGADNNPFGFGATGLGRVGNVAAAMANDMTGRLTRSPPNLVDVGGSLPKIKTDNQVEAPQPMPGPKAGDTSTLNPFRTIQPANPDALKRIENNNIDQQPLGPLPGYNGPNNNVNPPQPTYDYGPPGPLDPQTSFGQGIWNGIQSLFTTPDNPNPNPFTESDVRRNANAAAQTSTDQYVNINDYDVPDRPEMNFNYDYQNAMGFPGTRDINPDQGDN